MAKLVDRGGTLFEPLCLADWSVFAGGEIVFQFWEGLSDFHRGLAVDQMPRAAINWFVKCHFLSAARGIRVLNWCCTWEGGSQLEVLQRIHYPCCSTKFVFCSFLRTVYEWFCAIASVVNGVFGTLNRTQSKVEEELVSCIEVLVSIVDVCYMLEINLLFGCSGRLGAWRGYYFRYGERVCIRGVSSWRRACGSDMY